MTNKIQIIDMLKDEFNRWEAVLGGLSEQQLTTPLVPDNVPVKDVMAHLYAWQQRTIARVQAALDKREPNFPAWPAQLDPNAEEDTSKINAWVYQTFHNRSWSDMHKTWRDGFLHLIELTEAVPEADLLEKNRFAWLGEWTLADILQASYDHHAEHLEELLAWLHRNENTEVTE